MIDFKITPDGGGESVSFTATARDILVWERGNRNGKVFRDLMSKIAMEDMYRVAWIAARRLGHIGAEVELKAFETGYDLDMIEDEETEEGEQGRGPTRKAQLAALLSDSR